MIRVSNRLRIEWIPEFKAMPPTTLQSLFTFVYWSNYLITTQSSSQLPLISVSLHSTTSKILFIINFFFFPLSFIKYTYIYSTSSLNIIFKFPCLFLPCYFLLVSFKLTLFIKTFIYFLLHKSYKSNLLSRLET